MGYEGRVQPFFIHIQKRILPFQRENLFELISQNLRITVDLSILVYIAPAFRADRHAVHGNVQASHDIPG